LSTSSFAPAFVCHYVLRSSKIVLWTNEPIPSTLL
jgi:hypothetical protein